MLGWDNAVVVRGLWSRFAALVIACLAIGGAMGWMIANRGPDTTFDFGPLADPAVQADLDRRPEGRFTFPSGCEATFDRRIEMVHRQAGYEQKFTDKACGRYLQAIPDKKPVSCKWCHTHFGE